MISLPNYYYYYYYYYLKYYAVVGITAGWHSTCTVGKWLLTEQTSRIAHHISGKIIAKNLAVLKKCKKIKNKINNKIVIFFGTRFIFNYLLSLSLNAVIRSLIKAICSLCCCCIAAFCLFSCSLKNVMSLSIPLGHSTAAERDIQIDHHYHIIIMVIKQTTSKLKGKIYTGNSRISTLLNCDV